MRQTGLAEPRYHGNQAISHARGCTSCDRWAGSHNLAPWREVLQLCSHPVVGWPDASPGLFGLRSIQVAPV